MKRAIRTIILSLTTLIILMIVFFLFPSLNFCLGELFTCRALIKGTIRDHETGEAIANSTILLTTTEEALIKDLVFVYDIWHTYAVKSNANGEYLLKGHNGKPMVIYAVHDDYIPISINRDCKSSTMNRRIKGEPLEILLDSIGDDGIMGFDLINGKREIENYDIAIEIDKHNAIYRVKAATNGGLFQVTAVQNRNEIYYRAL